MSESLKRAVLLAVKIGISLALLTYQLFNTDTDDLLTRVRYGDMLHMAFALALYVLLLFISIWRWSLLLGAQGFAISLRRHRGIAVLLAIAAAGVAISLANQEGARALRAAANLTTVAVVLVLVARYLRLARVDGQAS